MNPAQLIGSVLAVATPAATALGIYLRLSIVSALAEFRKELRAEYVDSRLAAQSVATLQSDIARIHERLAHLENAREHFAETQSTLARLAISRN